MCAATRNPHQWKNRLANTIVHYTTLSKNAHTATDAVSMGDFWEQEECEESTQQQTHQGGLQSIS